MAGEESKKDFNAETLLNEHGKDISGLAEKVAHAYSTDRYEDFQEAVEKITLKTIDGTGRLKIKGYAKESAKEYHEDAGSSNKNFWVPNLIQIVIGLVALAGLALAVLK